jgi:hypothetical protein
MESGIQSIILPNPNFMTVKVFVTLTLVVNLIKTLTVITYDCRKIGYV